MAVVPKTKRRNSEKRKEHSRDAARYRRSREAEVFLHLAQEVPLPYDLVKLLDKTSIIRLTITYLKLRMLFENGFVENDSSTKSGGCADDALEQRLEQLYQSVTDGFLMIVGGDGDVLYVTDNISSFLGLTQIDVTGQSIFDLSHPCDHDEIREVLGVKSHQPDDCHRAVFIRMKCTITNKGRNVHFKSASYKVISCRSFLKTASATAAAAEDGCSFVVIIGQSIAHPSNIDVPLDNQTFVSRHGLDMKFMECDERIYELLGYRSSELVGKSMYLYHHALDTEVLDRAYKTLFCKGQASTGLYRFLAQQGGFVWIETHATVISNAITDKPEYVVCVNYVVSGLEDEGKVFDSVQLSAKMSHAEEEDCGKTECDSMDEDECVLRICPDMSKNEDTDDGEQSCMMFVTEKILEQATRDRDEADTAMINRISNFLLDPNSDILSHEHESIYAASKSLQKSHDISMKGSDEVGRETEQSHGMPLTLSSASLTSLLDKIDDGLEMRAPYIPMDEDLVFGGSDDTSSSYAPEHVSQLSCLMNSDPLLPSVAHESFTMTEPISPLFTVGLSSGVQNNKVQRSGGTKRSHGDAIDLTAATSCKVPRLDPDTGEDCLPRSNSYKRVPAHVSTVTMLSSPLIHAQQLTAAHRNEGRTQAEPTHKSLNDAKLFGLEMEKSRGQVDEVGLDEEMLEDMPATVYVLWNGQLNEAESTSDQNVPSSSMEIEQVVDVVKSFQGLNRKYGAGKCFNLSSGSNSVLDLTSPGMKTMKMTDGARQFSVASETGKPSASGASFQDFGDEQKVLSYKVDAGNGRQVPGDVVLLAVDEERSASGAGGQHLEQFRVVDRMHGLTGGNLVRLVAPTLKRKTLHVVANQTMEQTPSRGGNTCQDQYYPVVASEDLLADSGGSGRSRNQMVEVLGEGLPLHFTVRNAVQQRSGATAMMLSGAGAGANLSKNLHFENDAKEKTKLLDSASQLMAPSGSVVIDKCVVPLHLVQRGVTQAQYRPGEVVNPQANVAQRQVVVRPVPVNNARGQQLMKPGPHVFVQRINQRQVSALNGIGLQVAAPSYLSTMQQNLEGAPVISATDQSFSGSSSSVLDSTGSSVLMNLLMKGVDINYGYRLQSRSILDGQKQRLTLG